ncbi:MAG: alanine dehydrogenase [Proteobacteria bacterium ST_bin11]|nr:MAG: alanine dehydrogenase [Proteobacteria bacterium ST_bin11]
MKIGVPKEIKPNENRVSVVPSGVAALVSAGHSVTMESGAGIGAGFEDALYQAAGANLVDGPESVWASAEMIIKVKEPIEPEWSLIRPGQTLFTYFHFAANRPLTEAHLASGATCIAYETVQLPSGELPLLTPMSEVAGRLAVQEGAHYLEKLYGGRGMLLGGVPGVLPAKVLILGGGVVGTQAAKMAAGLGAQVTVVDLSLDRLRQLSDILPANVQLLFSSRHAILEQIRTADLVIGGVLVTGAAAPKLIRADDLKLMQPGAVIVDVAVDQGGCVETTHPTTHADPIYIIDNVVHYAVANMPGSVPRTSTQALTNATLPYALQLANKGWQQALKDNSALLKGLNIVAGNVTCQGITDAFGFNYLPPDQFLN